ncbi:hypothetical protein [Qipengyuania soli]|uniref:TonB-dependent receptor n=1 Tax=Qipengyuania soli TaxID=2782568 RepID=A0A7S8IT24_9SPHN|nr:hypothetical protein [Qipengyuania soli]QPC99543.1 hypothetical protein IRL76_02945 [Qipengyuania soli]
MSKLPAFAVSLAAIAWSTCAMAQDVAQVTPSDGKPQEEPAALDPGTIVVTGERIRGQLITDQPPVAEYDAADIAAFGGSSIADIISAIEPASGSARGGRGGGQPVFLINGIRVSSFREFRNYPPESIAKVEVFPEEVAQRLGFPPDQRVVNIVLKPNYSSITAELELEAPQDGGYSRNEQELTYLKITSGGRLNFNLDVEDSSPLTEDERGFTVPSSIAGVDDEAPYRTLLSDSLKVEGTANYVRADIDTGASTSLNATVTREESLGLSGLREVGGIVSPLETRRTTDTYAFAGAYNRRFGGWQGTFTTDVIRALGDTEIDRRDQTGFDLAQSNTWTVTNKATLVGYPLELPAGEVSTTFDLGLDWKRIESEDTRSDTGLQATRRRLRGGVNVSVPIAEDEGAWGAIGSLTANFSAGSEDLSDFGGLYSWTAGLNWSPTRSLNLQATRIWREVAPTLSDLGRPRIDSFNVPVFDFVTGDSVLATVTTGGNPSLLAETQADWKFGANWELPFWKDTRFQVDYALNNSSDVTLSSPSYSAAFESAFPDRVTRGTSGELLAIDRRPVTLFRTKSRTLSFGLNTRGTIGKARESGGGQEQGRGGPPGFGGGRPGAGGPGGGGGFDPNRFREMRAKFCAAPATETPDLSLLPERMRERLMGPDGKPDPVLVKDARDRFCSENTERDFEAVRTALCTDPPNIDALPPQILERLKREDGTVDPDRLAAIKERICAAPGARQGGEARSAEARGGGGRGGRGGRGGMPFGPGGGDNGQGRYFVSLNHSIALDNEIQLAPGGPIYDQLDGEVIGGGAVPKHTTRLEGGLFWGGYGLRVSGNYIGEAVLRGSGLPGSSDLFFGDLATVDLRLFADLGQALKKDDGFLKGFRLSLVVNNLFDGQRRVVDSSGQIPDAYDPRRIDPVGRYFGIDLRKQF